MKHENNFLESVKSAQKTVFVSLSISLIMLSLATLEKIEKVNLPIGGDVDAITGIWVLTLMYFGLGVVLTLQLNNSRKNYNLLLPEVKNIALLNPTLISVNRVQGLCVIASPILLFFAAFYIGLQGNAFGALLVSFIFSIPYYFALGCVYEIKA